MSIFLNVSNSLLPLSEKLSVNVKACQSDAFTAQWIVTQTEGMNSWLTLTLADQLGIAANIKFQKPNDIVSSIYQKCNPSGKPDMEVEMIRWCLFSLLGKEDFKSAFPEIARYYDGNDIKRISLAGELADLFDQYQVYRHTTIEWWNHEWKKGSSSKQWQQWLWTQLKEMLSGQCKDRIEMADIIIEGLNNPDVQHSVSKKMPELHFFGIAVITPYYLKIFYALSKVIHIHLYLINPAPEKFWLEDHSEKQIIRLLQQKGIQRKSDAYFMQGNDLLLNWGGIIKESFGLLFEQDVFINQYDESLTLPPSNPVSLLEKIQSDIYNNAVQENREPLDEMMLNDQSITINGCYSPLREVEVLYNYLVQRVESSETTFSARDILVMVTDIDLYAPYIDAVFSNAPHRFPYVIADETITSGNNLFTALHDLLSLNIDYFSAEEVLKLLESPYIRSRFNIRQPEIVRKAVQQAGIIFGIEGRTSDDTRLVSWNYGLKKIIYGLCMSGEDPYHDGVETMVPIDTDEGTGGMERIKLLQFVRTLQRVLSERNVDRTISQWAVYLKDIVESLVFQSGEKDDDDFPLFIQFTEKLSLLEDGVAVPVSFEVFRHSFLHRLQLEKKSASFAGAGITFCSPVPMRSIPFRIVAMLGMNFDKFPRKETPLSFSLLSTMRMPGDRNVKDNDKHLFLETLLSARKHLYVSYIARSDRDGSVFPPSSLLDECIDYVARGMKMDTDEIRKKWITIHPLHGFSNAYFKENGLISYLSEDRFKTNIQIGNVEEGQPDFSFEKITIDQLAQFMRNPPKCYLNKRLDVYYNDTDLLLPDHELFEFDSLNKSKISSDLLFLSYEEAMAYRNRLLLAGKAPLQNMGKVLFENLEQGGKDFKNLIKQAVDGNERKTIEINLQMGDTVLYGKLDFIFGNRYVAVSNNSKFNANVLSEYTRYLILLAEGHTLDFVFAANNKKQLYVIPANEISKQEANQYIQQLLAFYKKGHLDYFDFHPIILPQMVCNNFETFISMVREKMEDDYNYDYLDKYLVKAMEDGFLGEKRFDALKRNVCCIWDPLFERLPNLFNVK